ncbi:hypothetical protein CHS0354_029504 [Potamilus streckersoni]|uniref:Uncharacterized protein n=1 Tax=Potamilus streckersoni TaxID=2493646 RepID=A0AAE0S7D1_9BIVA|nr:hypothetical protein CHS0354_029504 [Potamilus streckersoni]
MRGDDVGRRKMGYGCGNKSCYKYVKHERSRVLHYTYGTEQNCSWNKYTPINSASESSMYILHRNDHYEPVLDVEDCEFQDLFSRPPYLPIRKYVPEKYWKYISAQTLEAPLVNNYNDEKNTSRNEIVPGHC